MTEYFSDQKSFPVNVAKYFFLELCLNYRKCRNSPLSIF